MKRTLILLSSLAMAVGAATACSVERSSTVLGPSAVVAATPQSAAPSLLGTSVVQGTPAAAPVARPSSASALPDEELRIKN